MRSVRQWLGVGALGAAILTAGLAGGADAQDQRVRWKMHSAFGSKLAILGTSGPKMEEKMKLLSNGSFTLKFFEPGALVPAIEYYDAVG